MAYTLVTSPLIKELISTLRNRESSPESIRSAFGFLSIFLAHQALSNSVLKDYPLMTPIAPAIGQRLTNKTSIVPILRAGLSISNAIQPLIKNSLVAHIGLYRDPETFEAVQYYEKLSGITGTDVIICDPLLATGNSLLKAVELVKNKKPKSVKAICIIGTQQGVDRVLKDHDDVEIFLCCIDPELNNKCYIVPGIGDAGDRLFDTR